MISLIIFNFKREKKSRLVMQFLSMQILIFVLSAEIYQSYSNDHFEFNKNEGREKHFEAKN